MEKVFQNILTFKLIKQILKQFFFYYRFDPENTGFVKSELFLKRLGVRDDSLSESFNGDSSLNGDDLDIPLPNVSGKEYL